MFMQREQSPYFRLWAIGALTTFLLEMAGINMTSAGL